MISNLRTRPICEDEISQIVVIHKQAFKSFFLTQLGDSFLKLYYKSVLKNKQGVLLGCYLENTLLGFCAATTYSSGFHSSLIKENLISYCGIGLKLLVSKPNALIRLYKNLTKDSSDVKDEGEYAELLSIGVAEKAQRMGVGHSLLVALEEVMRQKNAEKLSLTTDFSNNEKANAFYRSLGYQVMYEFIAYPQRRMLRYIKEL